MTDRPKGRGKSKNKGSSDDRRRGKGTRNKASLKADAEELRIPRPPQESSCLAVFAAQLPAAWGAWDTDSILVAPGCWEKGARIEDLETNTSPSPAKSEAKEALDGEGEHRSQASAAESTEESLQLLEPPGLFDTFASVVLEPPGLSDHNLDAAFGAWSQPAGKHWVVAEERHLHAEEEEGDEYMAVEHLMGKWIDSQGYAVHVLSTDAYDVRLLATLSKPGVPDKFLSLKPIRLRGGWQCGHSILDSTWSTAAQIHWIAADGRVTVWVRPPKGEKRHSKRRAEKSKAADQSQDKTEAKEKTEASA
eukprot:TRINITY_DN78589_c0_g1_i1.p1 TRINITY_DN78589_c0_g1~~TRINITY_DN78589_c0_g1_i1.p1  ORF type:complete len:306 (+),score=71.19 TRINITY_DN78589_c0_g1_i1:71-988(+)